MKPAPKIPLTSPELRDSLLDLIRAKFYQGHSVSFAKDRRRLLEWVVLYPATWLRTRGVTLPPARYRELLSAVLIQAAAFSEPTKVTYLPAYLRQVIRSYLAHHGDEIYDEAKSMRNLVDHALLIAGQSRPAQAPDPVAELATAARLLKPQKTAPQRPVKSQLTLF